MKKRIISLLIAMILTFSLAITCYASDILVINLSNIDSNDASAVSELLGNDYMETGRLYHTYFKSVSGEVYMSDDFEYLGYEDKTRIMSDLISDIQENEKLSGVAKQALYHSLSEVVGDAYIAYIPEIVDATTADIFGGLSFLAPFNGTIGIIFGVIVIFIVVMLIGSTVIDMAYLISPNIMHWFLDEENPKARLRHLFISREARYCADAMAQGTLKGNIYLAYFGKRWVTYLVLALCILYLLTGQIAHFIGGILDFAQRVIG